jgi:prepilin-type processing-associated H-X9-DG protein
VIGILALLIALLMPTLQRARETAKAVQCATQLRQIGQAMEMYASANRWNLPPWSGWHVAGGDGTGDDQPGPGWTEVLAPYLAPPTSPLYNCPSFPEEFRINYFLTARWVFKKYFVQRHAMKLSDIKTSTSFVISGDCTQQSLYPPSFGTALGMTSDDCDKDDATQQAIVFFGEPGGLNVHRGGNNVLFADSHVAIFRAFDPGAMTYHPTKMQAWPDVTGD